MRLETRTHSRSETSALIDAISGWEPRGGYVSGLHAGDLGWHLRLPDDLVAGTSTSHARRHRRSSGSVRPGPGRAGGSRRPRGPGASGGSVATPAANEVAVALYESAGMRQGERMQGLVRG